MQTDFFGKFKNYLIPTASILAVVFLIPTVVLPQITKIRENLKVVNENGERLDQLVAKAGALEQLAQAEDQLDKNLAIAESALPIEKDVARLVRGVQNLAAANGLEVSKVKIQPGKTATVSAAPAEQTTTEPAAQSTNPTTTAATTNKSELIFELDLRGNIANFQSFLKGVESTKRLLIMSSFKAATSTGAEFTFNVVVNAPFGPLPKIAQDQLAVAVEELSVANKKLLEDLAGSTFQDVTNTPLPTGPTGVADPFK